MLVMIAIIMIIAILLFLGILKLINKFIFKNKIKITWKEIIIGWCIVLGINAFSVITNIPFVIGIPYQPFFDGGLTTYYISLGYVVVVEKESIMIPVDEEKYGFEFEMLGERVKEIYFLGTPKKLDESKVQKGYTALGYEKCECIGVTGSYSKEDKCVICENQRPAWTNICVWCAEKTDRCNVCGKLLNEE